MEEQNQENQENQDKHSEKKWIKIISIICSVSILILLAIIKMQVESFSIAWSIVIAVAVLLIGLGIFFCFEIYDFLVSKQDKTGKDEIPKAITIEQAREIASKILSSKYYAELCIYPEDEGSKMIGKFKKSKVYYFIGKGTHTRNIFVVMMNMHFPRELNAVKIFKVREKEDLTEDNKREISNACNSLAFDPESGPDMKKTVAENTLTGNKIVTEETTHSKEKKDKKDEKKGDLK